MPVLGGIAAAKQIRELAATMPTLQHLPRVQIVAMQPNARYAEEWHRLRGMGFDGLLSKPITRAAVVKVLSRVIEDFQRGLQIEMEMGMGRAIEGLRGQREALQRLGMVRGHFVQTAAPWAGAWQGGGDGGEGGPGS